MVHGTEHLMFVYLIAQNSDILSFMSDNCSKLFHFVMHVSMLTKFYYNMWYVQCFINVSLPTRLLKRMQISYLRMETAENTFSIVLQVF